MRRRSVCEAAVRLLNANASDDDALQRFYVVTKEVRFGLMRTGNFPSDKDLQAK